VALRTRAEAKGAVAETGVKEAETPAGTPVAERLTVPGGPLSIMTETVVWVSPPTAAVPAPLEREMVNVKAPALAWVLFVVLVDDVDFVALLLVLALPPVLVLVLVALEVEVAEEDDEDDRDEDEVDKKVDVVLVTEAVEVDVVDVVALTAEPAAPWIASKMTAQLPREPFQPQAALESAEPVT
jgi:hypothetical protein